MIQKIEEEEDIYRLLLSKRSCADTNARVLWRGQGNSSHHLLPGLFRRNYTEKGEDSCARPYGNVEDEIIRFCLRKDKKTESRIKDLAMVQHHGAPTRLLDWTESPLVALYFACQAPEDADGKIFSFIPHAIVYELELQESKLGPYTLPADNHAGLNTNYKPWVYMGPLQSQRQIAQLGVFTVHPNVAGNTLLERGENSEKSLKTVCSDLNITIIPNNKKIMVLRVLWTLGIREEVLFPDFMGTCSSSKWISENKEPHCWTSKMGTL